jgi:hypothetical protein
VSFKPIQQNLVNHIALVLDASYSMLYRKQAVIEAGDRIIKDFAKLSQDMNQETRVTIYAFDDVVECLVADTDVLRLPSLAGHYEPRGNTALIDASLVAINELKTYPQKHGDHAFLMFVLTDGEENRSRNSRDTLSHTIQTLPSNWTVAAMVPSAMGKIHARNYGFPPGNIEVWDATTDKGVEEGSQRITQVVNTYMESRSTGTRSTTNLFDISGTKVNAQAILDAGLKPLDDDEYDLVQVGVWPGQVKPADWDDKKRRKPWKSHGGRIDEFIQNVNGGRYIIGQGYYQLVEGKRERIQASKKIAVVNKKTDKVYVGSGARKLLDLPDDREAPVKPTASDEYLVYVQSKSPNRLLVPGTRLLIMKK